MFAPTMEINEQRRKEVHFCTKTKEFSEVNTYLPLLEFLGRNVGLQQPPYVLYHHILHLI